MNWIQRILARMGVPVGASLAADIATAQAVLTTLETRLSAIRAGYLDQLDFALQEAIAALQTDLDNPDQYKADLTTLETRLSAIRAGYLDELDFDLQGALTAIAGYLDTEIAAILAAVDTEVAAIETKLDTPANFMADVSGLEASVGRALFTMDFWSALKEEILVTGAQTTPIPPPVVVDDLPGDAVIVRAIVMMKFRMVENDYAGENKLDATAVLPMQVDDGVTGMLTCINFVDEAFTLAETTREGGDVIIGDIDVAARVDGNDTYDFQWLNAKALFDNLRFNDVQMGIRIWYSV